MGRHCARELMDEALPIARFAHAYFHASPDVTITHVLGSQNYDAVVDDLRPDPGNVRFLEVTTTLVTYEESLRMELLNRDGHAPAFGRVVATGPRHARRSIDAEHIAHEHHSIVRENLTRIEDALTRKTGKDYPAGTALVVAVDDSIAFREADDATALDHCARGSLVPRLVGTQFHLLALQGSRGLHLVYPL